MLDLAPIKARRKAATPGPWEEEIDDDPKETWVATTVDMSGDLICYPPIDADRSMEKWPENRAFIAHALTDIGALVLEVERLRTLAGELLEFADDANDYIPKYFREKWHSDEQLADFRKRLGKEA